MRQIVSQFARPQRGGIALFTRWILRSPLVKVPSHSAKLAAGRMTSAYLVVSVGNISWTTRNSRASMEERTRLVSGSVWATSSPRI